MGGAFQMSREVFNNNLWTDIPKFRIFFYIVGNAVFSEKGVKKGDVFIGRGQFLRSYRNLSKDLTYFENNAEKQYSKGVLNRKIKELVDEERLTIKETKLGTLFTVCNYSLYQDLSNYKGGGLERSWNDAGTELERSWDNNKNVEESKEGKEEKPSRKYLYESNHMAIAELFETEIRANQPNFKKPNLEMWADKVRLMMERDGRTEEQIRYLIYWVQKDDFEMANVMSPTKLRARFDQLVAKVKSEKKRSEEKGAPAKGNIVYFDPKTDMNDYLKDG